MKIKVEESTKNKATNCEKECVCLSNDNHTLCSVEHAAGKDLLYIKCKDNIPCNYRMAFDSSSDIWTCPVRI